MSLIDSRRAQVCIDQCSNSLLQMLYVSLNITVENRMNYQLMDQLDARIFFIFNIVFSKIFRLLKKMGAILS